MRTKRLIIGLLSAVGLVLGAALVFRQPALPGQVFGVYASWHVLVLGALAYFALWAACCHAAREPRVVVKRLAAVTMALAFALGLVEAPAAMGLVDYRALLSPSPWDLGHWQRVPGRISAHPAHWTFSGAVRSFNEWQLEDDPVHDVDLRYDANGFRNARTPERADVAVIGDSFIESYLVPAEEILTAHLGRMLDVSVANLGLAGYGSIQERLVVEEFALPLRPRVVVWAFFEGNDPDDAEQYEARARAAETADQSTFLERSFTANLLRILGRATSEAERIRDARRHEGVFPLAADPTTRIRFGEREHRLTPMEQRGLELSKTEIETAHRGVQAAGAHFLVVNIPTKFRVYADLCRFKPGAPPLMWEAPEAADVLGRWCEARGIAFLDLYGPLRAAALRGELSFFFDDAHWNARGNELGAKAIAAHIRKAGWLSD